MSKQNISLYSTAIKVMVLKVRKIIQWKIGCEKRFIKNFRGILKKRMQEHKNDCIHEYVLHRKIRQKGNKIVWAGHFA